jgi:4-amino-4-deoxy-L-arabinose transferase-like glycosyltransferase
LTRSFYPDLAVLALCSAAWTCFLKSNNLQRWRWSILFGICAGLAQMTKWTAFLFWLGPVFAWTIPQWLLIHRVPEAIRERDDDAFCTV